MKRHWTESPWFNIVAAVICCLFSLGGYELMKWTGDWNGVGWSMVVGGFLLGVIALLTEWLNWRNRRRTRVCQ